MQTYWPNHQIQTVGALFDMVPQKVAKNAGWNQYHTIDYQTIIE